MGIFDRIGTFLGVKTPEETRDDHLGPDFGLADAALAAYIRLGSQSIGELDAWSALRSPAYWRAVNLIAGTIAGLPLKTYRTTDQGERQQVKSFLDNPAGPYPLTPFQWKELVLAHMLTQGETGLMHVYNGAGALIGLWPVHPQAFEVHWSTDGSGGKTYKVTMADGTMKPFESTDFTQVMGFTLDGLRGISPLVLHRRTIQMMHAQEDAATRAMTSGMLVSGLVSADEDIDEDEAKAIKQGLDEKIAGPNHAGGVALVNRKLKFTPWTMTAEQAQFLQGREFSVDEIGRMFGIPAHLLGSQSKATSWGTGIIEMNLALQKFTFKPWTDRLEETLSTLLPSNRFCEFDYSGVLQGAPNQEIELLIAQVEGGLLTQNEARAIRNLPPVDGGDVIAKPGGSTPPQTDAVPSPNPDQGEGK